MKRIIIILALLLMAGAAYAQDSDVVMYVFHGQGCPHCAKLLSFLDDIQEDYPCLEIEEKETYFNDENRQLFENMSAAYGRQIEGVPTVFIGNKVIVGFSDRKAGRIESEIQRCMDQGCINPIDKLNGEDPGKSLPSKLTVPAVISAAAVDAINPCAFAVLIILLTTILASGVKKRTLFAGLAFTAAIFISYFLMGIGLYSAVSYSGLTHTFFWVVAVLAIIVGLFNLKDYLWYGKWFVMEVPMSWRPKLKKIIKGITSAPGAFLTGFVVSLFLLPCTSGPYIVILGLLAHTATRDSAIWLLILYNLIFILPMIVITLLVYFGFTSTEKAEEWRQKRLKHLHLVAGIIILLLGIGMIIGMLMGYL